MSYVKAEDYSDISTLGINFKQPMTVQYNSSWPATGWTFTIPAEWKSVLRKELAKEDDPITQDSMYPPVDEVSRLAKYAATVALTKTS